MVITMARRKQFLKLVLSGEIAEGPVFSPFSFHKEQFPLWRLLQLLKAALLDDRTQAVVLIVKNVSIGWAQIEEVQRLLIRIRKKGKRVLVLLEQGNDKSYYLALAAERIYLPPSGIIELVGLRTETLFFKDLLGFLGVEPQLFNVGAYKSAAEVFQRTGMSQAAREMTDTILSDMQDRLVTMIAENRNLSQQEAQQRINSGPYTADRALSAGLVDGLLYEDRIGRILEAEFPGIREVRSLKTELRDGFLKRLVTFYRPRIALIVAEGVIHTGRSRRARGRWPVLGAETVISFLRHARRRRRVRAVVLRINSPGGSILASDLIRREVRITDRQKPVIVTFGDIGASGGYYVATAAREVLANPNTLTGSIGVIGGKFNLKNLFAKVGITSDSVEKGDHSGYASLTRPFSESEARILRAQMRNFYEDLFLPRVAESRSKNIAEIRRLAEGRVWTGAQAMAHGLVDSLGGLDEALRRAKKGAGLEGKKVRLLTYAHRRSLFDFFPLPLSQSVNADPVLALLPEEFLPD